MRNVHQRKKSSGKFRLQKRLLYDKQLVEFVFFFFFCNFCNINMFFVKKIIKKLTLFKAKFGSSSKRLLSQKVLRSGNLSQ